MKRKDQKGLTWHESELLNQLGVKHGFFTNKGGTSKGNYQSLNVKLGIGDNDSSVLKNRQLIENTLGIENSVFSNDLKHGTKLEWCTVADRIYPKVDALATGIKGLAIGLSTADCLPLIISDGRIVAVVHAGWRGTIAKIMEKSLKSLINKYGLDLKKTVAACGPCICKKHFEVRGEAAERLKELNNEQVSADVYHADLLALNIRQLNDCGIEQVDSLNICSYESEEFFSYRRDNGKTGRNMTIALLS